jgi:phospholipid/cholesterol/gamma-HCH transport system ATP-binding protein
MLPAHRRLIFRLKVCHYLLGGKSILQGARGTAASGKLTAIMGGSGSGKSTLLQCLRGCLTPDSGNITINGAAATLGDIQQMVGFAVRR